MKPTRSLRPRVKLNRAAVSELLSLLNTTQTELAQMCGLSPGYFSLLMAGKRSPSAGARGPILTPSESCASGTSPAAPGHCCRRCTTRLPPATSVPEETRLEIAHADDGGSPVRLRRDALSSPHNQCHPLRCPTHHRLQAVPHLHHALRAPERRDCAHRLPGTLAVFPLAVPVQHQRSSPSHR